MKKRVKVLWRSKYNTHPRGRYCPEFWPKGDDTLIVGRESLPWETSDGVVQLPPSLRHLPNLYLLQTIISPEAPRKNDKNSSLLLLLFI